MSLNSIPFIKWFIYVRFGLLKTQHHGTLKRRGCGFQTLTAPVQTHESPSENAVTGISDDSHRLLGDAPHTHSFLPFTLVLLHQSVSRLGLFTSYSVVLSPGFS